MKKQILSMAAIAMLGTTGAASAWWGGPLETWFDDFLGGDAWFSFSFSMNGSARGSGWNRYYDYYGPYGYPYAGAYAPPVYGYPQASSMAPEQQAEAQQHQARVLQQAVEAQRRFAERMVQHPQTETSPKKGVGDASGLEPASPVKGPLHTSL